MSESQGQKLALTGVFVPSSLDKLADLVWDEGRARPESGVFVPNSLDSGCNPFHTVELQIFVLA